MTSLADDMAYAERLAAELRPDYLAVRVLPDASVATLGRLITTTAIHLGCSREGWERRFCFVDPARAAAEFKALQSEDETPTGWIARRPPPAA